MLLFSLLALLLAPLCHRLVASHRPSFQFIDGFIFVSLGGLVCFHILPFCLANGGTMSLLWAGIGLLLPGFSERFLAHRAQQFHHATFILGAICLFFHAAMDGTAIEYAGADLGSQGVALTMAVMLHRFPVGIWIWQTFRPRYGLWVASLLLTLMAIGTVIGFVAAPKILVMTSGRYASWFYALVAGSLVHAIVHRLHSSHNHNRRWWEGIGNLVGGAMVMVVTFAEEGHDGLESGLSAYFDQVIHALVHLTLESAPALLVAYVVAGFLTIFVSDALLEKLGKGGTFRQAFTGVAIGLPLPVCSCSVVPLYQTLVRKGTPSAAAIAFLIGTPELGLDALLISVPLLGQEMTAIRLMAALVVAVVVAIIMARLLPTPVKTHHDGHHRHPHVAIPQASWYERLKRGANEGLIELVDHTAPWIVMGLILAALILPLNLEQYLGDLPQSLEVLAFALLGMPLYVCASGATPLVAAFLAAGVSPGAALAFLLMGPATNVTTFGVLSQIHGARYAAIFGAVVLGTTLVVGMSVNLFFDSLQRQPQVAIPLQHSEWSWLGGGLLMVLFGSSVLRRGARAFLNDVVSPGSSTTDHDHDHGHGDSHDQGACCHHS